MRESIRVRLRESSSDGCGRLLARGRRFRRRSGQGRDDVAMERGHARGCGSGDRLLATAAETPYNQRPYRRMYNSFTSCVSTQYVSTVSASQAKYTPGSGIMPIFAPRLV